MAQDYYRGKTVSVYSGYEPGGTNDLATRLVANHIGRHLGGNPTVIVKNYPGAASRNLASYLYTRAAKDGTEFGNVDRAIATELLFDPTVKSSYDILRFTWIGSPVQETMVCIAWQSSKLETLQDVLQRGMTIASPGAGAGEDAAARTMNALLGAKVRPIHGYQGGSDMNLAMQRGEVDGRCGLGWGAIRANYMDWITSRQARVLLVFAEDKISELPEVPTLYELAKEERDRQALRLLFVTQKLGRPFIAPPDMPEERRAALRNAFEATMRDPQFRAEAESRKFELQPVTGTALQEMLQAAYAAPKPAVERAVELVRAN
jgi:tripartite-type tricarboxylate transporter receptor subunit TctC